MKQGTCAQCDVQILVRNLSGKFMIKKPIFKEASLFYDNGIEISVALCQKCFDNPDMEKIMTSLRESKAILPKRDDLPTRCVERKK